ncbi:MAG: hypothetical protein FWH11_01385 [Micrococcales bacterium]|nr:hypothetical protein [Micrococcales bacterium]
MSKSMRIAHWSVAFAAVALIAILATACDEQDYDKESYRQVEQQAAKREPYIPKNHVEADNYNRAQELYDSPDTIIWCTTTWGNASAPLVTVPIAGKLTSSSVSYFPGTKLADDGSKSSSVVEARSVDGMFHGSPPPYRYGFTPGGQYVDFSSMPTFCTTSLTSFQRQSTTVTVSTDTIAAQLQEQAEQAMRDGDPDSAQQLLGQLDTAGGEGR